MSTATEAALLSTLRTSFKGVLAEGALDLQDDAAILPPAAEGFERVLCADQVVEGQHFAAGVGSPEDAGWRALVRNLSDLAAMGARPVGFLWTIALPGDWAEDDRFRRFLAGAAEAARAYACPLYGGDLGRTDGPMVASVSIFGDVEGRALRRKGARAGDHLYVSRALGASAAGLDLLLRGEPPTDDVRVQAHLRPTPELALGQRLVGRATACMDLTDGLLCDLDRLLRASGVGAELTDLGAAEHPALPADAAEAWVKHGGEDLALLFSGSPSLDEGICIGRCVEGTGMFEVRGPTRRPLDAKGWDPFRD